MDVVNLHVGTGEIGIRVATPGAADCQISHHVHRLIHVSRCRRAENLLAVNVPYEIRLGPQNPIGVHPGGHIANP